MKIYFTFKELCITNEPIPIEVADKLLINHMIPMSAVRKEIGLPITASQRSGYRPYDYEISKGRKGTSEHTFKDNKKGAIDWTCEFFKKNNSELLELIVKHTSYSRMAVYNGFIHCDYKKTPSGKREIYTSTRSSKWTLKQKL